MIDFTLTSEQELIQKTAREFAKEHLAPGVIERDDKAEFPTEQIKVMGELGFMGMMVPEEWGGAGFDTLTYVIAMEEIAAVELATSTVMSVNNSLVCQLFVDYGTEEQKEKYLKPLAIGEKLGAYSLSEPQSGSDASNMRTFAKKEGDHYVINGTKNWVTNGISSDIVALFCVTEKGAGYKGISAFAVEKGTPGLRQRLEAARRCAEKGYKIGIHLDPVILFPGWKKGYCSLIDETLQVLSPSQIEWVSLGSFRYRAPLKQIVRERHKDTRLFTGEHVPSKDGKFRYLRPLRNQAYETLRGYLKQHSADLNVYMCMETREIWEGVTGKMPRSDEKLDQFFDL